MKAVVFEEHGDIDVLKYTDVPEPQISPNEVLIKVKASGCNYNDIWARRGLPGVSIIMPHISGSDAAGEVVEVGSEVTNVKVGDEVVVFSSLSCGTCDACARGDVFFCRQFKIWGFQTGPLDGAHAEYAKVPAFNVVPKPKDLGWEQAASMPLVLFTAWRMLVTQGEDTPRRLRARLGRRRRPGHDGRPDLQAVQCQGHRGRQQRRQAPDRRRARRRLHDQPQQAGRERGDTQDHGASRRRRRRSSTSARRPGRQASAPSSGAARSSPAARPAASTPRRTSVFSGTSNSTSSARTWRTRAEFLDAWRWVESGDIKPAVFIALPLKEAGLAQKTMEDGQVIGKVVLTR